MIEIFRVAEEAFPELKRGGGGNGAEFIEDKPRGYDTHLRVPRWQEDGGGAPLEPRRRGREAHAREGRGPREASGGRRTTQPTGRSFVAAGRRAEDDGERRGGEYGPAAPALGRGCRR